MSTNIETVLIVLGVWFASNWLDENYPIQVAWGGPLALVGMLAIVRVWWRLFSHLMREYRKEQKKGH